MKKLQTASKVDAKQKISIEDELSSLVVKQKELDTKLEKLKKKKLKVVAENTKD